MSLKQAAREALKGNDIEVHQKLIALRRECRERGIDEDKVTSIIRSVIHEDSKPKPKLEPVPPPETAAFQTAPEEVEAKKTRSSSFDKELSMRAQFIGEQTEGLTPSGTKKSGAASGRSILDMVESK